MRLPKLLSGKHTGAAVHLVLLTGLSKTLGFLRELFLAWAFGTSAVTDAYRLCLSYTTYFSHFFLGEAMTGTLVPFLANPDHAPLRKRGIEKAAWILGFWTSIPVGLVFALWPSTVLGHLAPTLPATVLAWARPFLRLFGFAVPVYSLTSLSIMARQSAADFRPLGWRPIGQSLSVMLGTAVAFVSQRPVFLPIAFGVYYAWLFLLVDRGHLVKLMKDAADAASYIPLLVARWAPLAAGLGALQTNLLVERYFAAQLPAGTIASLDFARVVTEVPLLTVGVPTGAVILVAVQTKRTGQWLDRGRAKKLGLAALAVLGLSALIVAFPRTIATVLYRRGAFGALSVDHTSLALRGLGAGAWAVAGSYVLGRWLMATRTPWSLLPPAVLSLTVNVAASTLLTPKLGVLGLALAQSAAVATYFLAVLLALVLLPRTQAVLPFGNTPPSDIGEL